MENKTLKEFLKKNRACEDSYFFAKDLTLEEFLNNCERGDWVLWLFARINPESIKELTLAKAHCANTVRHLMEDERSLKAVDVAIAFGEGKANRNELEEAYTHAVDYAYNTYNSEDATACAAYASYYAADATSSANVAIYAAYAFEYVADTTWDDADASEAAEEENQKQTADICRQYLPLEIWNQSKL